MESKEEMGSAFSDMGPSSGSESSSYERTGSQHSPSAFFKAAEMPAGTKTDDAERQRAITQKRMAGADRNNSAAKSHRTTPENSKEAQASRADEEIARRGIYEGYIKRLKQEDGFNKRWTEGSALEHKDIELKRPEAGEFPKKWKFSFVATRSTYPSKTDLVTYVGRYDNLRGCEFDLVTVVAVRSSSESLKSE